MTRAPAVFLLISLILFLPAHSSAQRTRNLEGYIKQWESSQATTQTCDEIGKPILTGKVFLDNLEANIDQKTGNFSFDLPAAWKPGRAVRISMPGRAVIYPSTGLSGHFFLPDQSLPLPVCVYDPMQQDQTAVAQKQFRKIILEEFFTYPWPESESWGCTPESAFLDKVARQYKRNAKEVLGLLDSWFDEELQSLPKLQQVDSHDCTARRKILYSKLQLTLDFLYDPNVAEVPLDPSLAVLFFNVGRLSQFKDRLADAERMFRLAVKAAGPAKELVTKFQGYLDKLAANKMAQ
ncbi:MAG TPA: hypothetical protein VGK36_23895 [Candidatus Angelobacter sp.]|jgi:hypothetical protein